MTPEVVIYRYLEISAAEEIEFARVVEILGADADLLRNWLVLLELPADPQALRRRFDELPVEQFQALAPAQAWVGMPFGGTARLSPELWATVLRTTFLAQVLAERESARHDAAPIDLDKFRWQVLLALSGVQLPGDDALRKIHRYRGVAADLLVDAAVESRIFAVVEGVEVERDQEIAAQLLDIGQHEYLQLSRDAQQRTDAYIAILQLGTDEDNDWARRIWQRQRVAEASTPLLRAFNRTQLLACHGVVSKSLFNHATLLLLHDKESEKLIGSSGQISVSIDNKASQIATCFALRERARISDASDVAVVDREVLYAIDTLEAVVLPVARDGVLVVHVEDDHDTEELGVLYAEQVSRILARISKGELHTADVSTNDVQSRLLEELLNAESQRLRELVHEANNPLSIVNNYLHILGMQLQHEPDAVEKLALISAELHRAEEVISRARNVPRNALSQLLEGDAQETENELIRFDLNERMRQLVELHKGYASEHGVLLDFENTFAAVEVYSDPGKVSQIITNLLRNAIEASPAAQRVRIEVAGQVVRGNHQGVIVLVRDRGPGIGRDVLAQLTTAKNSDKGGGHQGVGLKICFELAKALGGAIDLKTQPLVGTEFALFLPLEGPQG